MIIVTGTKRSGTSMWMQVLIAAGLPHIGEAFLGNWEDSIRLANPKGFYESPLRKGVYYATNPHPRTGEFIHPGPSKRHAVKVFIPGVVRSDYAYLWRVVATMRHWRAYHASLNRLYEMEDRFMQGRVERGEASERDQERRADALARRDRLPPVVEWWFDNYKLIRDIATRRYPVNLVTYERLLQDPEPVIAKVLDWLGGGDVQAACAAIDPGLRNFKAQEPFDESALGIDAETLAIFDELHHQVHTKQALTGALLKQLNVVQDQMEQAWLKAPPKA